MASILTPSVDALVAELARLPGIGPRSAQRLAFHLLKAPPERPRALA
jgi:recombination protein RecR